MATQFEVDFALMAGTAYRASRSEANLLPIPGAWVEVPLSYVTLPSGFQAVSFQRGEEIVVAFAGTDEAVDWIANSDLALGFPSDQLKQAALYYLQVKEANPDAEISFTGHSLGGGLAALMGVLFDKRAVTFDQAPFAASASTMVRNALVIHLNEQGYSEARASAPTMHSPARKVVHGHAVTRPLFTAA